MHLKEGTPEHIRGFIMNKLYWLGCFIQPGKTPKKHFPLTDMKKGYKKQHWGDFDKQFKTLTKEGVVYCFPHAGGGEDHIVAVKSKEAMTKGLTYANAWLREQGMPPLTLKSFFKTE